MIKLYNIKDFDFMGYNLVRSQASFHHLIIAKRDNGKELISNGAVLTQNTSHDYLHKIELIDYDAFLAITSEMIDENIKGYLDVKNIRKIHDILKQFEKEYCSYRYKNGKLLIKENYIKQRRLIR